MPELAFIVTNSTTLPDATKIVERAGELGQKIARIPGLDLHTLDFELESGEQLGVRLMTEPIPDLADCPTGPTSAGLDKLLEAPSHIIVHVPSLGSDPMKAMVALAALTTAVMSATEAVAAMLGDGVVFHREEVFVSMAEAGAATGTPPPLLLVEITVAPEDGDRMSFLTHGLTLTGRDEELYVTCSHQGDMGLNFVFSLIEEFTEDPNFTYETGSMVPYPTEDGIGPDVNEPLLCQRQANPTGEGPPVMRIDLPDQV